MSRPQTFAIVLAACCLLHCHQTVQATNSTNSTNATVTLDVKPTAVATLQINGTKFTCTIQPGTFLGLTVVSLTAVTYNTTALPFLVQSFTYSGSSRILELEYGAAALKAITVKLQIESPTTAASRRQSTVFEPRVFWLNKKTVQWNVLCSSVRNQTENTVSASIPTDVLNGDAFNPYSDCASAVTSAGYCGTGGLLMILSAPPSICLNITTTPPAPGQSIPAWQIVAIVLSCVAAALFLGLAILYFKRTLPAVKSDGYAIVDEILPGFGASVSGQVQIGDVIRSIDGISIVGRDLETIRRLTLGPEGSICNLLIYRGGMNVVALVRRIGAQLDTLNSTKEAPVELPGSIRGILPALTRTLNPEEIRKLIVNLLAE
ncbi:hypothetical protein GUITHDRAFT_108695 [Guillardia theta CCMP2712]|uniref:PDZ domain-containing protein n=1 Tax=Guillardia theta (strain CCMP2712) TaxID=905079 RepID=L1JA63_GUITC|nr:hypothetical protein GUITHDRAFT_108695 [Guillardia theta CCMP2712]EKX45428.1 hypothetical protein GUITHDRAFT_108695 [Guillardia theta CCMP2712]|eukprot:XP_005832408.1 hypothetical protein GUITHDRAFT_108695 [Guillardia theta CCMP2712]